MDPLGETVPKLRSLWPRASGFVGCRAALGGRVEAEAMVEEEEEEDSSHSKIRVEGLGFRVVGCRV